MDLRKHGRFGVCSQQIRLNHLEKVCRENDLLAWDKQTIPVKANLVVNEKFKIAYCPVLKASSRTWRKYLLFATGLAKSFDDFDDQKFKSAFKELSQFSPTQQATILNTYTKFMVVRNPFQRLESTWREKLITTEQPYYRNTWGKVILSRYRGRYKPDDRVRFEEFVKYIVAGAKDLHWTGAMHTCQPCSVKYDYILRTETSLQNAGPVLEKLNMTVALPRYGLTRVDSNMTSAVMKDYAAVDEASIKQLLLRYNLDMEAFGYQFSAQNLTAKCSISQSDGEECC